MTGITSETVRADDKTKTIPVIAISAAAMPHEVARGMDAGFEAYVTKPNNVSEVLSAISAHIG